VSDFRVIRAVSETMKSMLEQTITNSAEPDLKTIPVNLHSPKEMRQDGKSGISLWLYRVMRDSELLNTMPDRTDAGRVRRPGLPIHLYYLVTPLVQNPEDRHTLLGRILQTFNDHAVLRGADLTGTLKNSTEQLRVTLETLTLEELTRIWVSLSETYDVSVTYEVQVVTIDSDLEDIEAPPVVVKRPRYAEIVGEP